MLPTIEIAEKALALAGKLNPGSWTRHSLNTGIAARNIAEKIPDMDSEKAYILGLLHDIGRRTGNVSIPVHILEGYRYSISKGWNEVARVCMTHSYPLMEKEPMEQEIKEYILGCQCDGYDMLIQLCDSLSTDYGFCILEKSFVDVVRRYGIRENTIERWNRTFEIKEMFEKQMNCSIYDVLPNIEKTTLLSPPSWNPKV